MPCSYTIPYYYSPCTGQRFFSPVLAELLIRIWTLSLTAELCDLPPAWPLRLLDSDLGRIGDKEHALLGRQLPFIYTGRGWWIYFFCLRGRSPSLPSLSLHYDTISLQRIRIIVRDAGFEPGTSAPEVWSATNEPPYPPNEPPRLRNILHPVAKRNR